MAREEQRLDARPQEAALLLLPPQAVGVQASIPEVQPPQDGPLPREALLLLVSLQPAESRLTEQDAERQGRTRAV
jgi:hypothetical protein